MEQARYDAQSCRSSNAKTKFQKLEAKTTHMKPQRQIGAAAGTKGAPLELAPGLYVVATPIGNARDISLRALDCLRHVDAILVEDSRVTSKLLAIHDIRKPLVVCNDHAADRVRSKILTRLQRGERLALVTDAGTPSISDPGFKLVREAIAAGLYVTQIPGACSLLPALVLSGLPADRFMFCGFLPPRPSERAAFIAEFANVRGTLIFFETGPRLASGLKSLAEGLGPRAAAVARELTKKHEEITRGDLASLASAFAAKAAPKGEIVIVVAPPPPAERASAADLDASLGIALEQMSVSAAAADVAKGLGLSRRTVYERALLLSKKKAAP
jgi:16S rRNA (cytidine1402-2'-O)-methyltransferase